MTSHDNRSLNCVEFQRRFRVWDRVGAYAYRLTIGAIWVTVGLSAVRATSQDQPKPMQQAGGSGYWVDSATGLMWATRDNGEDISWGKAAKYCRKLQIARLSDWRLASLYELATIYDEHVDSAGLAGYAGKQRSFTWHVKGRLYLTGEPWSSERISNDRGKPSAYQWYFDFNSGQTNNQPSGWPYSSAGKRALCVRSPDRLFP